MTAPLAVSGSPPGGEGTLEVDASVGSDDPVRYIVGFHVLPRDLGPGDAFHGATVLRTNGGLQTAVVETEEPSAFRLRASLDDDVAYVEEDRVEQWIAFTPNDPRFGDQYGPQQIRAPEAWDTTLGDTDKNVCIVDTGVRYTHEDLEGVRWLGGHDFANDDSDPWDDNGHGTHVAGTAAAWIDNGAGIAGLGNVGLLGVKVLNALGSGTLSDVADGITWCADNGGDVVSLSLGASSGSSTLQNAVDYAWDQGSLVVAAAGNDGPCTDCVSFPAAYANAIAVTCTDSSESQCSFSSQGPEAELAAPGDGILSTCYDSDTSYCTKSGTSMSTPHVSGAATLVWSHNTSLSNSDLRTILQDTAQDLGDAGHDNVYGHGEVDAKAAMDAAGAGGGDDGGGDDPAESTVTFEDFDDGTADGWSLSGLWHVSDACETPPSTPNYLGYNQDSDCTYDTGSQTTGSAAFEVDLTDATVGTLNFQHKWETESFDGEYDVMRVQVSTDGGSSWTTLKQWDARDSNQLSFGPESFDLDAYVGGVVSVRFFFDSVDSVDNANPGWFVDDVEVTADLDDGGDTNSPPTADAGPDQTVADDDGSGDESVTLDGTGSSDSDGTIESYEWTEDGTLIATGATPTVTLDVGSHTITLTVTDDEGATDSDDVVVTVNANEAPTASFTDDCSGLDCTFDASGSSDPDGSISSYDWDFGDGTTGTGELVSHTYGAEGTYTVTLTVTDNGGATDTASRDITVTEGPTTVFEEDFDDGSADGWEKSGLSNDLWRLADDCVTPNSGTHQLAFSRASPDCDYDVGTAEGWARTPVMDLSGFGTATLTFAHFWETESYDSSDYDRMQVQVSSDGGSSWTTIQQWDSTDPNPSDWATVSFDVSSYISDQFRVRYRFDSRDSISNDFLGWYVDDVEVTAE